MNITITPPNAEVSPSAPRSPEPSKKETALVAWLAFMILGGGLLALYYARIGYLPDIEWHLTLVYVAVASFIGGAYGILQSLAIFLPGYVWSETLIYDSYIMDGLCHDEPNKNNLSDVKPEPSVSWVFEYIGLWFLVYLIASHIVLWFVGMFLPLPWGLLPYALVTISILAVISKYVRKKFRCLLNEQKGCSGSGVEGTHKDGECEASHRAPFLPNGGGVEGTRKDRECESRLWKYTFWFDLSALLSQIASLLIYYISGQPTGLGYLGISLVCICVVSITNHVVAVRFRESHRQAIVASIVASLLLLVAADQFTHLPEKIMDLYGFGRNHKVDITLAGTDAVGKLGLSDNGCGGTAPNKLCGVEILSAIGSDYLIRLGDDKTHTDFTLPKSMVVSHAESCSNADASRPCERK